jgi:D-alanyl-D-alanine carboxypeptidase
MAPEHPVLTAARAAAQARGEAPASAMLRDFPDQQEMFSTPTVVIHRGTFHSQNDLLRTLLGADGMKTGFTCGAGYNVVASATRDGRRLIAVG